MRERKLKKNNYELYNIIENRSDNGNVLKLGIDNTEWTEEQRSFRNKKIIASTRNSDVNGLITPTSL